MRPSSVLSSHAVRMALQAAKDSDAGATDALQENVSAAEQALQAAEHALKKVEEEHA